MTSDVSVIVFTVSCAEVLWVSLYSAFSINASFDFPQAFMMIVMDSLRKNTPFLGFDFIASGLFVFLICLV